MSRLYLTGECTRVGTGDGLGDDLQMKLAMELAIVLEMADVLEMANVLEMELVMELVCSPVFSLVFSQVF